jgi:hypothetical protein
VEDKAFFGLFGVLLVLQLAWWACVVFVIVKVLQHFGIL